MNREGHQKTDDRLLTTLAILQVNAERGQSHLDNYLPFVYHCLALSGADVASTGDLQSQLGQEFGIEIPQGVLQRLLKKGADDGKLRLEDHVFFVEKNAVESCNLSEEEGRISRSLQQLVDSLQSFAQTDFQAEWTEVDARQHLLRYVDGFSSRVLSAAVGGQQLPAPHELGVDDFIVHRFASRIHERDAGLFDRLVDVVKGRMLADALYYLPNTDRPMSSLEQVAVYFDGPLLLYLLGYAGEEIQAPYTELIQMLKRQNAILRCFEHNVMEAQEILDAAARRARTGQVNDRFHGDVVSHLVRSGLSRAEIELRADKLPRDLLRIGIQPVHTPSREPRFQPDEERLGEALQARIHYTNTRARDRDLDSLTAIYRLRRGRTFREIGKCEAVLVAHNFGLFKASAQFFKTHGRSIPLCIYDSSFTTLIWLQEPQESPKLPSERILASAYAALNPKDELWQRFNKAIDELREAGAIDDEDARFLRFADESREALMDYTRGQPDALTQGSTQAILERSRQTVKAELSAELTAEQQAHAQTNRRVEEARGRATEIAGTLGSSIANALFGLLAVLLIVGTVFGPIGPIDGFIPAPLQAISAALAVGLILLEALTRISLRDIRDRLATKIGQSLAPALIRLFRL